MNACCEYSFFIIIFELNKGTFCDTIKCIVMLLDSTVE